MNIEALRIFEAVATCGGFHAAGKQLHRSQPAVTMAVRKLEDDTGLLLFDRNSYRPTLTPDGEKLLARTRKLLEHREHFRRFTELLRAGCESDIRIAIDAFFPLSKLQSLFRQWVTDWPETEFHFLAETLGGATERLVQGEADIAIAENLLTGEAVEVIPLHIEPLVAVATPAFIQEQGDKLYTLETLSGCMQVILRDSSSADFSFGVTSCSRHWTVRDVLTKKAIILASLGWGRLPKHCMTAELDAGILQPLQGHHFDERHIQLCAIRLQKTAWGPISAALWEDLQRLGRKTTGT